MEFVQIPKGSFMMGSGKIRSEEPIHKVTLSSFYIMTKEVTNLQLELCPKFKHRERGDWSRADDQPACNLSFEDAQIFAEWLSKECGESYTLPTDAEWEYAARGGLAGYDFPWGDGESTGRAWFGQNEAKSVGTFAANGYELFDMCGNASEMVLDGEYEYTSADSVNPVHPWTNGIGIERGVGGRAVLPWVWFRLPWANTPLPDLGFRLVVSERQKS